MYDLPEKGSFTVEPKLEEQLVEKTTRMAKMEMENNFMFKRSLLLLKNVHQPCHSIYTYLPL